MWNEQPADRAANGRVEKGRVEKGLDVDRLLAAVESFGHELDRAALLRRVADAARDLLGCDDAELVEETGGSRSFAGPVLSALLAHARASGRPTCVSARDLLQAAHDGAPEETWAIAPLPQHGATGAVVAAWRNGREPAAEEVRALGVIARWAAATMEMRDRRTAVAASLAASEEFVSAAAHELRTPLTPLRLTIDRASRALTGQGDRERAKGALARVDEHVRRMTHVVDSLLEASRVARGDLVLVRRDTDLSALVQEVIDRHAELARQSRCEIRIESRERIVGRWDAQRLREVVSQLLANAIKFGGGFPVRIELSRDGDLASMVIRDEGHGIGAADQERIFGRFERAVSVRNFGGLGVGLWLAREIARAHGGDVTVVSAPGEGASFSLQLPISHRPGVVPSGSRR